jgi:hypothetical protein
MTLPDKGARGHHLHGANLMATISDGAMVREGERLDARRDLGRMVASPSKLRSEVDREGSARSLGGGGGLSRLPNRGVEQAGAKYHHLSKYERGYVYLIYYYLRFFFAS